MHTRVFKGAGIATAVLAVGTLAAWNAPNSRVEAAPTKPAAAVSAPAAADSAVPVASYAPVVEHVMPAVVTIRVEKRASAIPTDSQIPEEFRRFFGPGFGQVIPRMPRGIQR